MKKTYLLAAILPLFFLTSCDLFKKDVEDVVEEAIPVWTSAQELSYVEYDFVDAYYTYRVNYSGGYQDDIRTNFKNSVSESSSDANGTIADKYHDWRVDNPDADGDTFLSVPGDDVDYLYPFFEDYPGYFSDFRNNYTVYGEEISLDFLQTASDLKTNQIVDDVCQEFIENWRIASDNTDEYDFQALVLTGKLGKK